MYGRRYQRKRGFKRVVVTLLSLVMLVSVCFPGLRARADGEENLTVKQGESITYSIDLTDYQVVSVDPSDKGLVVFPNVEDDILTVNAAEAEVGSYTITVTYQTDEDNESTNPTVISVTVEANTVEQTEAAKNFDAQITELQAKVNSFDGKQETKDALQKKVEALVSAINEDSVITNEERTMLQAQVNTLKTKIESLVVQSVESDGKSELAREYLNQLNQQKSSVEELIEDKPENLGDSLSAIRETVLEIASNAQDDNDTNLLLDEENQEIQALASEIINTISSNMPQDEEQKDDKQTQYANDDLGTGSAKLVLYGEKEWDDDDNEMQLRPDSITVELQASNDGGANWVKINSTEVKPDEIGKWLYSFDVSISKYTMFKVVESPVPDYYTVTYKQPDTTFEYPSAGSWDKQPECSSLVFNEENRESTIIVVNKGNQFVVWTMVELTEGEQNLIKESLKDKSSNISGYKPDNTVFFYGYGTKDGITVTENSISFGATSGWSVQWRGTYKKASAEATNSKITNKIDSADLTIVKTFEGLPETETKPSVTFTVTGSNGYSKEITLDGTVDEEGGYETSSYTATLTNLPLGNYTVTETTPSDVGNYKFSSVEYTVGETKTSDKAEVTLTSDGATVAVKNTYELKTTHITLDKVVKGNMGDINKEFKFNINVNGQPFGDPITMTDGTEVKRIEDIPIGATVVITESDNAGYMVTATVSNTEDEVLNGSVLTFTASDENGHAVVITNTKDLPIDTGFTTDSAPFIVLFSVAVICAGVLLLNKSRYTGKF